MVRVSRFLWIFSLLCLLLSAASGVLAFFQVHIAGQICLSLVKLIALILAWLLPRKILSKSFAKSLEKSQRFQNLQNVFIQKEIQEFNRDLVTHFNVLYHCKIKRYYHHSFYLSSDWTSQLT